MIGTPGSANETTKPAPRWLLPVFAIILAGFFAVLQLSKWPARLRYPGEENFIQGTSLTEMLHLRQGIPIYALPSADGFDAANYGPLYYLLGAKQSEESR